MKIRCFSCHKFCSTEIPDDTIISGTFTCLECEELEEEARITEELVVNNKWEQLEFDFGEK